MEIGSKEWEDRLEVIIRDAQVLFRADSEERIREMEACLSQWNWGDSEKELVRRHAHAMKGVALTLGFRTVHLLCEELLGEMGAPDPCRELLAETMEKLRMSIA